jgi:hypothetical protein
LKLACLKYPYQNRSVAKIRGEKWKDIPGFEGIYQASNYGRVRSLDRTVQHSRLGEQYVQGRILSQSIARNRNIKTGEPMIDLRVSLSMDGQQYYYNVRRLIYFTFVNRRINFQKDGLYVINKNGDGFNNRVSNLRQATKSEKQQRVFARHRQDSYLKTADRSKWPKTYGGYANRRAIKQYTMKGKLLRRFESIREAARKTGFDEKGIIGAAKGEYKQWKGYKWKYV